MQKQVATKKVVIVGCGPVGMFGALLLQNFGMDFAVVQKNPSIRAFPYANWINSSTKSLFTQISGLVQQLNKHTEQQKWQHFSHWRYVETIFGFQYAKVNKFEPTIQQRLKDSEMLFGEKPCHIAQNKLLKIMYGQLKNKEKILFNQQIAHIKSVYSEAKKRNEYLLQNSKGQRIVRAQYVIMCNGKCPKIQQMLPTENIPFLMQGQPDIMNFLNIHFTSDKLAEKFKQSKTSAMYHFIYNKRMIGILNNLSIQKSGQFVLQVVNYEPFVDLLLAYNQKQIIEMMFDDEESTWQLIKDITIINSNKWKLSGMISDRLYSSGIFLAGDSAHSIHPVVAFGINPGLHDIHELVHALFTVQRNPKADRFKIFNRYSNRRCEVNYQYLKKSFVYFEESKKIEKSLGFSTNIVEIFSSNSLLKSVFSKISEKNHDYMQKIRLKSLRLMSKGVKLEKPPPIELFMDVFDIAWQRPSILKSMILKKNKLQQQSKEKKRIYTLYAREWCVTIQEIKQLFGDIQTGNIKFFNDKDPQFKHGQRLISSDGTILLI